MRKRRWVILFLLLLVVGGLVSRFTGGGAGIKTGSYLLVDIKGNFVEGPPEDLVGRLLAEGGLGLFDVLQSLRAAARDERIAGLVLRVGQLETGWAKARELREALLAFKRSGKPVIAVMEQETFASNLEYYVASVADRVHLAPATTAPLTGLASQFLFLGGLWEKLDIDMHVEKVREYKTMGDFLAFKKMTPEHREMANAILDGIDAEFVGAIADSRGLEADAVRDLIDQGLASPTEFREAKLSDGIKYLRTVHDSIGGEQTPLVDLEDYADIDVTDLGLGVGPRIGVLYASGAIVSGESGTSVNGSTIGADTISEALDEVAKDDDVVALVMRVDSPGGSALASDLIWRARHAVQDKKPVVVSMSDLAASGGYYISVGADRILAQPTTLTGSIGVVVARPMIRGLLADAGINSETLTRGKYAHMSDLTVPLADTGKAKLGAQVRHIYREFVDRVASGRKMTADAVDEVARGRVWTGAQAVEQGLVDELGGFWDAIDAAKELAGLDVSEEVELVFYPRPKPFAERIAESLGMSAETRLPEPLARILGTLVPPFAPGTILTMMPYAIDVR
jgi:protease-4